MNPALDLIGLREFTLSAYAALNRAWTKERKLLDDATIELGVDLELYEADVIRGDRVMAVRLQDSTLIMLLDAFLEASPEPADLDSDSALNNLTRDEMLLVLASHQLSLLGWLIAQPDPGTTIEVVTKARLAIEVALLAGTGVGRYQPH